MSESKWRDLRDVIVDVAGSKQHPISGVYTLSPSVEVLADALIERGVIKGEDAWRKGPGGRRPNLTYDLLSGPTMNDTMTKADLFDERRVLLLHVFDWARMEVHGTVDLSLHDLHQGGREISYVGYQRLRLPAVPQVWREENDGTWVNTYDADFSRCEGGYATATHVAAHYQGNEIARFIFRTATRVLDKVAVRVPRSGIRLSRRSRDVVAVLRSIERDAPSSGA